MPEARRDEYRRCVQAGYRVLGLMEAHLREREFLVGSHCSVADISLFAYTHVAGEGGFDLSNYPAINAWITRICALPGFVGMND